uniref:Uncharacterized protein n=1 Tax=Meloidogyne enterolobii TaxID=390850 RepID=A0A6V7UGV4_MELEN|nr:unnamed protein product [Meloidogyne enterolobii]
MSPSSSSSSSSNQLNFEDNFSFDYPSCRSNCWSPPPPSFYCSSSSYSLSPPFYYSSSSSLSSSLFSSNSYTPSFPSPSAPFSSLMCSPSSPSYSSMSSSSSFFSSSSFSPPSSTLHHFHHILTPSTKQQLLQQPQFHSTKLPQTQQHYKNQQLSSILSPFQKFRNRLVQISRRIGQSQQRRKFSLRNCGGITKTTTAKTLKTTSNKCRKNIKIKK